MTALGSALTVLLALVPSQADPGWFWNAPHCDTVYGDGSVTITKKDGEINISSDGDVQVDDLAAAGDSLPLPSLPSLSELPDFDHIYECLEDAIGNG